MTNNEAISRIKFLLDVGGSDGFTSSDREAMNAAINALSDSKKPKTNGDRIRAMTDEELANEITELIINAIHSRAIFYGYITYRQIVDANLEWLQKEAESSDER